MASDATVQLSALCVGEGCRVCFEAFPDRIEQLGFFGRGKAADLIPQIAHCLQRYRYLIHEASTEAIDELRRREESRLGGWSWR